MKAEMKIELTKSAAEKALLQQRMEFESRERKAEEKLHQFELARERERR